MGFRALFIYRNFAVSFGVAGESNSAFQLLLMHVLNFQCTHTLITHGCTLSLGVEWVGRRQLVLQILSSVKMTSCTLVHSIPETGTQLADETTLRESLIPDKKKRTLQCRANETTATVGVL